MERKYFSIFICLSVLLAFSVLFSLEYINIIDDEVLNSSKEVIQIDEFEYSMTAFLWRDFMPISPIDGKPLMAAIRLHQNESSIFCTNLVAEKMWIDNNGDIWETDLTYRDYQESENGVVANYVAYDGPKWTTGILVDVYVQIKDTQTNSIYYLKSLEVEIIRTE